MKPVVRAAIVAGGMIAATVATGGGIVVRAAQEIEVRSLRVPKISAPVSFDDFINTPNQRPGLRVTGFRQREPGDGAPVSQDTAAYLFYDDTKLHVVFVCHDVPGGIRSRLAPRKDIAEDDQVSIYLDTFHDRRHAYVFTANPNGVQEEGLITEGGETENQEQVDKSFDTLWDSQGRLTPDGYVVWMAIPFKSLRFSGAPAQTWGIALARTIIRNNETSFWPYVTDRVQGFVQQMATLEGLEGISSGHNVQMIPYATMGRSRILTETPAFQTTNLGRIGFDAKVVMRGALTFDLAVKPDFSEVESNDPQVLSNQRFEVFFPEKRPLFTENAGYFRTPVNLFYSRRVVEPRAGARLTGKVGGWVIGALAADDISPEAGTGIDLPAGQAAGLGVFRLQREFGDQSNAGVLVTSSTVGATSNQVASVDSRLKLGSNWTATGQLLRSFTKDLTGHTMAGNGILGAIEHAGRHFSASTKYVDLDPDFRTELGFVQRYDIRELEQFASYVWRPENRRVLSFGPAVSGLFNVDHRGRTQDWLASPSFVATLAGQTELKASWSRSLERFQDINFEKHNTSGSISTAALRWLTLYAFVSQGVGVNYFPGRGLTPFLARTQDATFTATLRPAPRLRLDEMYIFSRLDTRPNAAPVIGPAAPTSRQILQNQLVRSRLNMQFTRELSLRTIVDYNGLASDRSLTAEEGYKRLTGDVLLTWMLHPGTAIYVGYTDQYENQRLLYLPRPVLQPTAAPTLSSGRQVFVKFSYLWRF